MNRHSPTLFISSDSAQHHNSRPRPHRLRCQSITEHFIDVGMETFQITSGFFLWSRHSLSTSPFPLSRKRRPKKSSRSNLYQWRSRYYFTHCAFLPWFQVLSALCTCFTHRMYKLGRTAGCVTRTYLLHPVQLNMWPVLFGVSVRRFMPSRS